MSSRNRDVNPKDAVGARKVSMSVVPATVLAELSLAMLEGARKHGRHNWRVAKVRAGRYYDACFRHLMDWWEGEDIDPDSGLNHVTKAIASLTVLRDAMILGTFIDDRGPKCPEGWLSEFNKLAAEIVDRYPDPVEPYFAEDAADSEDDEESVP